MVMSSRSENPARTLLGRLRRRGRKIFRGAPPDSSPAITSDFDWQWYVQSYSDLARAGIMDQASAVRHWQQYGRAEGRRSGPEPRDEPPQPPPGFDWKWYVQSYTDLAPAGITDEASAIRHWREHGRRDGRRFAPRRPNGFDWTTYVDHFPDAAASESASTPTPASPPRLVCPSVDSIFLRAWGDLVCWDDAGSDRVLQSWDPAADYADVFLDGPYEQVRRSVAQGRMAWPEECERCLLLRVQPPGAFTPWNRRAVRIFRVEPSYYCSLDCPGCVPLAIRRKHSQAFQLDPEILDRILRDLTARGISVEVLDFQGHGEPLLNPRLWEMGLRSREILPEAWISVTTNAQGHFRPEMARSGFDDIICSIDGVDAETYEPYRVHGNFDLAWRFMSDFAEVGLRARPRIRVVWKYVLFEHNSSPEALRKAQRMALEAGVSELVFILTRNGPAPRHIQFPSDVPRLEPGPPISFRFHQPSLEDLEARLEEARRLARTGRDEDAADMTLSVQRNLERFFPSGADRPERSQRLFEETARISSSLCEESSEAASRADGAFAHAELPQKGHHRTGSGESRLEQVHAHEGSEEKECRMDEVSQGHRSQDERSGDTAQPLIDRPGHARLLSCSSDVTEDRSGEAFLASDRFNK
jgi:radical SAM family protein